MQVAEGEKQGVNTHNDDIDNFLRFSVVKQLAKIVSTLSSKGIFHNDIKFDNICLHSTSEGPKVTLIDFGLASTTNSIFDELFPLEEVGYFPWIAPEVLATGVSSLTSEIFSVAYIVKKLFENMPGDIEVWVTAALSDEPSSRPTVAELLDIVSSHEATGSEHGSLYFVTRPDILITNLYN